MRLFRYVGAIAVLSALSVPVLAGPLNTVSPSQVAGSAAPEVQAIKDRAATDLNRVIENDPTLFGTADLEPCAGAPDMLWDAISGPRKAPSNPNSAMYHSIRTTDFMRLGPIAIYMISGNCPANGMFFGPVEYIVKASQEMSFDWSRLVSVVDLELRRTAVYLNGETVGDVTDFSTANSRGYTILTTGERMLMKTEYTPDGGTYSASVQYGSTDNAGIILTPIVNVGITNLMSDVVVVVETTTAPDRTLKLTYYDGGLKGRSRWKGGRAHGWSETFANGEWHKTCFQNQELVLSDSCPDQ